MNYYKKGQFDWLHTDGFLLQHNLCFIPFYPIDYIKPNNRINLFSFRLSHCICPLHLVATICRETERVKHICNSNRGPNERNIMISRDNHIRNHTHVNTCRQVGEWHSLLNVCLYGIINSSVITQPPLRLRMAAALNLQIV